MFGPLSRKLRRMFRRRNLEIAPDEVLMDSHNLPQFNQYQMEGRLVVPLSQRGIVFILLVFALIALVFSGQMFRLQVVRGEAFAERSTQNRLGQKTLFADRGVIFDRAGRRLAWNSPNPETNDFSLRQYATSTGLSHILGYVKYPQRDSGGIYYRTEFVGADGAELLFNDVLSGANGRKVIELDARRNTISENVFEDPKPGDDIELSIDAEMQQVLYDNLASVAQDYDYQGGSAVIIDIHTGEVLALTSYPEYDLQKMTGGDNTYIQSALNDPSRPFLNRAVSGLYAPGSTVKPYMAIAALEEGLIGPHDNIYSSGELVVPNPYDPDNPSIFRDWKAHGYVDMSEAIAVSSNIYFYEIGGGFKGREGLGIGRIAQYMDMFGFGKPVPASWAGTAAGNVPTPDWKERTFPSDGQWRLGNTYHTSIGQYGFQVTPLQEVRAVAAIANGGTLPALRLTRSIEDEGGVAERVHVDPDHFGVAREGMREAVTDGYVKGLLMEDLKVAAKTGTAEVGANNAFINSWVVGFFPYEEPKYAFAVVMERGPSTNNVGSVMVMRRWFDKLRYQHPEFYPRASVEN